jgi:hypothetical protein
LAGEFAHQVVDHAVQYVDGKIHTNGPENFDGSKPENPKYSRSGLLLLCDKVADRDLAVRKPDVQQYGLSLQEANVDEQTEKPSLLSL